LNGLLWYAYLLSSVPSMLVANVHYLADTKTICFAATVPIFKSAESESTSEQGEASRYKLALFPQQQRRGNRNDGSVKCNSRATAKMEESRIHHDHTSALYAIRLSTVWDIRNDISAHTLEGSLMRINSRAARSDFLDPMTWLNTQKYTTTLIRRQTKGWLEWCRKTRTCYS